jgi:tetratricopeptide (TPR) repeat protein
MKKRVLLALMLAVCVSIGLWSCATRPVAVCTAPGDTAEHHYVAGMEALAREDLPLAQSNLERSVYCDTEYVPGYAGLVILYAQKAAHDREAVSRNADREKSLELIRKTERLERCIDENAFILYLAVIRANTAMGGDGWFENAQRAYARAHGMPVKEEALIYYQDVESLDYFMGLAFLKAGEFQQARDSFARVLNAKRQSKWFAPADAAWKKTDKIVRAEAGPTIGDIGRKIAAQDFVTRADLSVLLVDTLKIDSLFRSTQAGPIGPAVKGQEVLPADVAGSPFKGDIQTVLRWRIRGLQPSYDAASGSYLFKPDNYVKRGEMALLLEDLIIRNTGHEKLASAYLGQEKSPFVDVQPTSPFYNAVMTVTARGIMEGAMTGRFQVDDPVSGADAVLAVRALQQRIKP